MIQLVMRHHRGRLCRRRSALCIPALGMEKFLVSVVTAAFLLVGQLLRLQTPCTLFVFGCAGRFVVLLAADKYHGKTRQTAQYNHTDRGADGMNKTKQELRVVVIVIR